MQIDIKPLRCFVALATELNFSRAAARVHLSQPALSARLRALEAQLGFALVDRTTRRVALTPQGRALLAHVQPLLDAHDRLGQAVQDLKRDVQPRLRLGAAFYTIDIPERVALAEGFFARHPDVPLEVTPAWQNQLVQDLDRGTLDAALLLGLPVPRATYQAELAQDPATETLFPDDLPRLVLRHEPVALLLPREHPAAMLDVVPAAALAGSRVAMLGPVHGSTLVQPILHWLARGGVQPLVPPEPHAVGVERFARQFRLPAITLGWFSRPDADDRPGAMVRRRLDGLELATQFSLVRAADGNHPALASLWDDALAARHTPPA
jgi:DNA-binding transcriptional LysR family regulator